MKKYLFIILMVAVIFAGCGKKEAAPSGEQSPFGVAELPGFVLSDLTGAEQNLQDYKGKVLIVDFWATWCAPCRKEIPDFIALKEEYGEKGLEIIGISLDDSLSELNEFVKANKINYPVLYRDQERKIVDAFGGIKGIPTTFIIDREGKVVRKFVGLREKEVFKDAIEPLL